MLCIRDFIAKMELIFCDKGCANKKFNTNIEQLKKAPYSDKHLKL